MICRVCDSRRLEAAIDLGSQPWCNHFLKAEEVGHEPFYPLRLVFCIDCATAQLDYTVPKETMFADHTYLSGVTRTLSDHFAGIAAEVDARFFASQRVKAVLDIGSNDGTQLKHYRALGYEVLGVESSQTAATLASQQGVPTLRQFFNLDTVRQVGRTFEVINASGVFFHLEELHSVTDGIREALSADGVFVVQFLYMHQILKNGAFDQIYHEHLLYYNLQTIEVLLNLHGLEMFDAYLSPIHGGSIMGFVGHAGTRPVTHRLQQMRDTETREGSNELETYLRFADRIKTMRHENIAYLRAAKKAGRQVYGMGAPVKGNTLLNYFHVGPDLIQCLVERNPLRKNLYSPGMHIPVVLEDELDHPPDIYYVLAWNFKQEILNRYRELVNRGIEFYFPINPAG